MITKKSEEFYSEALKHMPAGVNSPVRAFRSVGGTPLYITRGSGAHVTDEDGNEFIDYCMSWGPLILGHADTDVVEMLRKTLVDGTSFGTPHRYEVELASLVKDAYPSVDRLRFVNSGTEATMSAIRLARGYTGKNKIVKFEGCYHGHADFLLVAAGSGLATFGAPDSAGVTQENAKDTIVMPYNDADALESLFKKDTDIAAVIMEPVPCNYGLIIPDRGYLEKVRELCDRFSVLLIFDEVINGFRLSRGGAQEYFNIRADLTTLGKIIGGGLPVGAYGGKKEIMDMVAPDGPVYQAGTLSGNPLAMAAGIATVKKLENGNLYKEIKEKAEFFRNRIQPAIDKYSGRFLFLQLESIFTFNFTSLDKIRSVDDVKKNDAEKFACFHREMLSGGIYLAPSAFEVGFISAAHTQEDLEKTAAVVAESLDIVFQ